MQKDLKRELKKGEKGQKVSKKDRDKEKAKGVLPRPPHRMPRSYLTESICKVGLQK